MSYDVLLDCGPASGTRGSVHHRDDVILAVDWPKLPVPNFLRESPIAEMDAIPIIEYRFSHMVAHPQWKGGRPFLVFRPAPGYA